MKNDPGFSAEIDGVRYLIRKERGVILPYERLSEPHYHQHYYTEFHYVCSGSETICFRDGKSTLVLHAGDLCMIPPECHHNAYADSVERICFSLLINSSRDISIPSEPTVSTGQIPSQLMRQYRRICEGGYAAPLSIEAGMLLLSAALQMLFGGKHRRTIRLTQESDRRAIIGDYISENFDSECGLSRLAALLHLSERRTRSIVRELMGEDFKALVVRQRMEVAHILIARGEHTLEEIASIVGYRSYSGFYTAYRNFFGHTPTLTE